VRAGEIVGLAGLVGLGRTGLASAIVQGPGRGGHGGRGRKPDRGGRALRAGEPANGPARGPAMIPESRKERGLLLGRSVAENVSPSSLRRKLS
jgi:ribose transport system ATP-binding protein